MSNPHPARRWRVVVEMESVEILHPDRVRSILGTDVRDAHSLIDCDVKALVPMSPIHNTPTHSRFIGED